MPSPRPPLLSFTAAAAALPPRRSARLLAPRAARPVLPRAPRARPASSPRALHAAPPAPRWQEAAAPDRCLRLTLTLACGQAFRWHDCGVHAFAPAHGARAREWAGVVGRRLLVLRQAEREPPDAAPDPVWWRVAAGEPRGAEAVVRDYFRLAVDHTRAVERFCHADPAYNTAFPVYRGCRVVRQEPVECLFGFICSSNNNVKRIAAMVTRLAARYGESVGEHAGRPHFVFPPVHVLAAEATEEALREDGFGYRAKFVVGTAAMLRDDAAKAGLSAEELLCSYRALPRKEVARRLVKYPGVGRKVASCAALFSLDQLGEIPCDTHIWQIATSRYMPELKQKSLTERVYDQVGDFFRARFGEEDAGLAQTMLFVGELAEFKGLAEARDGKSAGGKGRKRKVKKRKARVGKVEKKKEKIKCEKMETCLAKGEDYVLRKPSAKSVTNGLASKKRVRAASKAENEMVVVEAKKEENTFVVVNTSEEAAGASVTTGKPYSDEAPAKRLKAESLPIETCSDTV